MCQPRHIDPGEAEIMTTVNQIKALLEPVLERNRDLILVNLTILCLVPVRHVARMIEIRRSSSADAFSAVWRLCEHFIPCVWWTRTCGWCEEEIWPSEGLGGHGFWQWSYSTMPADFVAQVETVVLPLLRSLENLEGCAIFSRHHLEAKWCMGEHWQIAVDAALGDIATAQVMWETIRPTHETISSGPKRGAEPDRFREIGEALLVDDRVALAEILHRVEAERIAGSFLKPYWESVPFPLER